MCSHTAGRLVLFHGCCEAAGRTGCVYKDSSSQIVGGKPSVWLLLLLPSVDLGRSWITLVEISVSGAAPVVTVIIIIMKRTSRAPHLALGSKRFTIALRTTGQQQRRQQSRRRQPTTVQLPTTLIKNDKKWGRGVRGARKI